MRLSKIKLSGFKSFVDPTTIDFPNNLTGIVGPNGCGKSNVIDAVRWVMGESSAKNLRGDSMADVIFNGSTSRKPVGQANIELVFDNSDATLGGQYAQYNEISIKRVVSRDGQSVYFLNGARCRRRDITDIFLGTGLGPRSYAIIEQGTISRLIEAKPEDLRVFIEEAAGISKYKERRRETETRIRHTRDNLSRISDLREELDKRLQVLQRQATAAEKYKELKQEERQLKAQLLALRLRDLSALVTQREQSIQTQETALEAGIAELRRVEVAIEKQREQHIEATEAFNQSQGHFYTVGAEISRLEQAITHAKDTRAQQERSLVSTEQAWNELAQHLASDRQRIETLAAELNNDEQRFHAANTHETTSATELAEAEAAMQAWQHGWDEFNQRASAHVRNAEVERARAQQLEQHLTQLQQRLVKMQGERADLNTADLERDMTLLHTQVGDFDAQIQGCQAELQSLQNSIGQEREIANQTAMALAEVRGRLQNMQGRHASLSALQEEALGKRAGAVTTWLKQHGLAGQPRLAEELKVEPGWERAVEQVLGLHLESVCINGVENIASTLASLQHGRVNFFDMDAPAETVSVSPGQYLSAKISAAWPLQPLVGGVYVAEGLDAALAMRSQLRGSESVITPDGIWLGRNWLRLTRDADEKAGVLAREQELKQLAKAIDQTATQVQELVAAQQAGQVHMKALEESRSKSQIVLTDTSRRHAEVRAQHSGKQARLENMRMRLERLTGDIDELHKQVSLDEEGLASTRRRLHEALALTEGHTAEREQWVQQRDQHRINVDSKRQCARTHREAAHEIALRIRSLQTQLQATRENLQRMEGQLTHSEQRRNELRQSLAKGDEPLRQMGTALGQALEKRLSADARLSEARRWVEELDHGMRQLSEARNQTERKVSDERVVLEQNRMTWQEIKVRAQTMKEQLGESGFEWETLQNEMPADAGEANWIENIERIERQIARLGAINLAAIDECAEQSQRKQHLDAQFADLNEALDTLENAIRKIDRETRTRFKDTFDKINVGLQAMFPRLFGGGHAYLELTGEDLLDTGVTVMARPPGKRNSTIHLLSGGEKALTAVALVFAIFELNPAPFCMLDEVDAPLDDANVGRFCELVRAMSEHVQFIFITHNKTTMEMANQLTGVTMHEPGVSRLVVVDIDEAAKFAAAS